MARGLRGAVGALLLVVVLAASSGCSSGPGPVEPTAPPTPLARLNDAAMSIPRIDFCSLVPAIALRDALRTRDWKGETWGNGDRADVAGSGPDVVAEHGCRWRSATGDAEAAAWVFADVVDGSLARSIVRQARAETGCQVESDPSYGDPTLTQDCLMPGSIRVRHAGLFGQTWLTCEVTGASPPSEHSVADAAAIGARADAWCVEVANALNTSN